ncbi:MAG: Transposase [uncultured bacterium]|nr:MAG: Transposase [uncultured bacterium]
MPARNSIKQYSENGYYHIYNRGVEKRKIFLDQQDYSVLLSYLREYLLPKDEKDLYNKLADPTLSPRERDKIIKTLRLNNFSDEITLIAYCLMPNHFHFFVKQKSALSIDKFMQSLCTRYTMYFNRKYKRVGSLFQAVYKAVQITGETQFIYLSKYIHKQALSRLQGETLEAQPSSFNEFVGQRKTPWVFPEEVLSYFSKSNPTLSYHSFVIENQNEDETITLDKLILET